MPFLQEEQFKGPVPGQGMTAEPQSRPWFNPPEITTVEQAAEYYLPRLGAPKAIEGMLDAIDMKIPLTVLAETLTTGGVMQGVHTIDVAVLINPVIVEFLKNMAESAGVEYDLGDKTKDDDAPSPSMIKKVISEFEESKDIKQEDIVEDDSEPMGLMSRKKEMV